MNESELRELFFRIGARCNIEQYEMLKRCSQKKDITEWNEWRKANPDEEIWLSGAELQGAHLEDAYLLGAHLKDAVLMRAYLKDANLEVAYLGGANLWLAHLEGTYLRGAYLEGARLTETHLEGARLRNAYLRRAKFDAATVDGETLIWGCEIDKETCFTGVGLDAARVEPGLKQLLQYNIRRKRWREWYKEHRLLKLLVWPFWQMSDYGRSTGRVIGTFFILAFAFAGIYFTLPGLVENLHETGHWFGNLVRAVYFSIVTMTTLGFGDMYAHSQSIAGHLLLMLQVLLGYVLLGALITRLAYLTRWRTN